MRSKILAAIAALFATQSAAQTPRPPKLLVVISVDQFSAKLFDEYRPQFTGGLARLASGTAFVDGYQSHAGTETCPGHSTILTGARPARTGIVANEWQVATLPRMKNGRETFAVYCVEKPGEKSTCSSAAPVRAESAGNAPRAMATVRRVASSTPRPSSETSITTVDPAARAETVTVPPRGIGEIP